MPFWSGEKLLQNRQVIRPFFADHIDCAAYNLRMGEHFYRTAEYETGQEQKTRHLQEREAFIIPPGQFAYLLTKEAIYIPNNVIAFISMKTGLKLQGLINVSGFHVDPGYQGRLIFAVQNASPSQIQICESEKIFKIWFADLDRESEYIYVDSGHDGISSEMIKGMNKEILSLQTLADKRRAQEADISKALAEQKPTVDFLSAAWNALVIGVVIVLVASALGVALPLALRVGEHVLDQVWDVEQPAALPDTLEESSDEPARQPE